jgi:hypothetical protein
MKTWIVLLTLVCALGCGGSEQDAANIAQPGTEVPTQTTNEVVAVPAPATSTAAE